MNETVQPETGETGEKLDKTTQAETTEIVKTAPAETVEATENLNETAQAETGEEWTKRRKQKPGAKLDRNGIYRNRRNKKRTKTSPAETAETLILRVMQRWRGGGYTLRGTKVLRGALHITRNSILKKCTYDTRHTVKNPHGY